MASYHLGCGDKRLSGYVNVDIRSTAATDLVADLSRPALTSADCVFSNAFFEHLRRDEQVPHLEAVRQSLSPEGLVCYMGLPDFKAVAALYLNRGPGTFGPRFDIYNAYRYTHGDPEAVDPSGWLGQLHKSLLDAEELTRILSDAGFPSYVVFSYVFPREPVAVSLGFCAMDTRCTADKLKRRCHEVLDPFAGEYFEAASLRFVDDAPVRRHRPVMRRGLHSLAFWIDRVARL